ncbi:hypothetical protein [Capillimicrobium parvum]|uniref:Uncharacterized protein n=1 Tax=Capillimicrobium parvum TaxID=2884022 RepID=A0A9E6Y2P2_9ACTN|nr:hypothetical protein [Capillimicrobium parvum]UGS38756.1 hypothetical protein DSM104329_05186 [Capillimicrobium parvum]
MRSRRTLWLPAACGALIVLALLVWGIPWVTKERADVTSTPTPPAFSTVTPITLSPGSRACESSVAFSPQTRSLILLAAKQDGPTPPLRITARAPGYRAGVTIPGGYAGLSSLVAAVPPPQGSVLGEVCVENAGRRKVQLQATAEGRIQNRATTSVDGEPVQPKMTLLLTEGVNRSLADRPGEILDRIAAFKPPFVGSVSLALLALLVVVGVPAGVLYAIWRGLAAADDG